MNRIQAIAKLTNAWIDRDNLRDLSDRRAEQSEKDLAECLRALGFEPEGHLAASPRQMNFYSEPETTTPLPEKPERFANGEPLARNGDESTSHQAGEKLTRSGMRDSWKRRIWKWLLTQPETLTSREIAEYGGFPHPMTHKRLPDLLRDGYVTKWNERDCRISGNPSVTWRAIPR